MTNGSTHAVDIICVCNTHGLGGAQLDAGLLASEFRSRGYKAEVCFLYEREPEARHGTAPFSVVAQEAPRSPVDWLRLVSDCTREFVDRNPRAIIGFQPTSNVISALAARHIRGCKMVATQRNPSNRQSRTAGFLERLAGSTRLYHANIAISDSVAASFDGYPNKYRKNLSVVRNAAPSLLPTADDRAHCRARFDMPPDQLVLGCLGRLHEQKNLSFALEVLAGLPEGVLFIAGEGPQENLLRTQSRSLGVEHRVRFLGSLSGVDVTRFYQAIDTLLFPSIYEGFGRVLAEAMSQGVPVVASDIPIVSEVANVAVLARPLEIAAWVEAVGMISSDPNLVSSLASLGRERATVFGLTTMVDGYLVAAGLPHRLGESSKVL